MWDEITYQFPNNVLSLFYEYDQCTEEDDNNEDWGRQEERDSRDSDDENVDDDV